MFHSTQCVCVEVVWGGVCVGGRGLCRSLVGACGAVEESQLTHRTTKPCVKEE